MNISKDVIEKVEASNSMNTSEKETTVTFGGDVDDRATVTSFKATIVRSLLRHDHAEFNYAVTERDGPTYERIHDPDNLTDVGGTVVGVSVLLPIATVTIKSKPRSNNHHSSVVST